MKARQTMKDTRRKLIGRSIAVAALAVLVGCGRDEGETTQAPTHLKPAVAIPEEAGGAASDPVAVAATNSVDAVSASTNCVAATLAQTNAVSDPVAVSPADVELIKEIEANIAKMPDAIAEEKRNIGYYPTLKLIDKLSNELLREKYYESVLNAALSTRFERIGERVAQEYSDEGMWKAETFRRTSLAYNAVFNMAIHLCGGSGFQPPEDRWRPYFAYYNRMKEECARMNKIDGSFGTGLLDDWALLMENDYNNRLGLKLPPEGEEWFKRRFEEVVGRPPHIKTWKEKALPPGPAVPSIDIPMPEPPAEGSSQEEWNAWNKKVIRRECELEVAQLKQAVEFKKKNGDWTEIDEAELKKDIELKKKNGDWTELELMKNAGLWSGD